MARKLVYNYIVDKTGKELYRSTLTLEREILEKLIEEKEKRGVKYLYQLVELILKEYFERSKK